MDKTVPPDVPAVLPMGWQVADQSAAAFAVLDVNPCAVLIKGGISLPACQRKLAPLAVSAPGVGNQYAGVTL